MALFSRPNADITDGGWSAFGASDHYACLDETSANDATDYIHALTDTTAEVGGSDVADPGIHTDHHLVYRGWGAWSGTPVDEPAVEVQLWQGGSMVATTGEIALLKNNWVTRDYTLSTGEAGALTASGGNYTGLSYKIISTHTLNGSRVTQVYLQVPDVTAPTAKSGSDTGSGSEAGTVNHLVSGSDTGSGADDAETADVTDHSGTESGAGVDAASKIAGRSIDVSEEGTATEDASRTGDRLLDVSETGGSTQEGYVVAFNPGDADTARRRRFNATGLATFAWDYDDYGVTGFRPGATWRPNALVGYLLWSVWGQIDGLEYQDEYEDRPDLNPPDGLSGIPDAFYQHRVKFRLKFRCRRGVRALGRSFGSGSVITAYSSWYYTPWYVGSNYARLIQPPPDGLQWRQWAGFTGPHPTVTVALHDAIGQAVFEENYTATQRLVIRAPIDSDLSDPGWEWKRARPCEDIHVDNWQLNASVTGTAYAYGYSENQAPYWSTHPEWGGGGVWWLSFLPFPFPTSNYALTTPSVAASGSVSGADPGGFTQELLNQDYGWTYDYEGLGFHIPIRTRYLPSDSSIQSSRGAFDTARGFSHLRGSPHDCAFEWMGNDGLDVSFHQPPPAGQLWTRMTPPAASLLALPSWAITAAASIWKYQDGTTVNARMQHRFWGENNSGVNTEDILIGEWDANDPYRYPVSGDKHWLTTICDDGAAQRGSFAGVTLTTGYSWPAAGAVSGAVLETNLLLEPSERVPNGATVEFNYFLVKRSYADATLHDYMRSANRFLRGRTAYGERRKLDFLHTQLMPFFECGRLSIADTHTFAGLLDTASKWKEQTNTDYTGSVAIALTGGDMVFTVTGGPVLATTRGATTAYHLRYFAYRYARLRVKAKGAETTSSASTLAGATSITLDDPTGFAAGQSIQVDTAGNRDVATISGVSGSVLTVSAMAHAHAAGVTVVVVGLGMRLGVGAIIGPGGSVMPEKAWELTLDTTDDWQTVDLDLAFPTLAGKVPSTPFSSGYGYNAYSDVFHPAVSWANFGLDVWFDFQAVGVYTVDYLQGYHDNTGTRTPILMLQPFETVGTAGDGNEYDFPAPDPFALGYVGRWITNGAISADLISDYIASGGGTGFFQGWWNYLFDTMDDAINDTGVTVTKGTSAGMVWPHIDDWEFSDLPYGDDLTPGTEKVFRGCLRLYYPRAYYGMGDPVSGIYGRAIHCRLQQVVGGEAMGLTPGGSGTVILADNDTEATVVSTTIDDDGAFRLPAPYGVRLPWNNVTETAEFTGAPPAGTYTTQGLLMNSYWLHAALGTQDGDGYVLSGSSGTPRKDIPILDRFATLLTFVSTALGADITATMVGLHRVYREGTRIYAETSAPDGRDWVGTRVEVCSDAAADALPTICADRWERLFVWYHTGTGAACRMSKDYGRTWQSWGSGIAGRTFPRALFALDDAYLVSHNGSELKLDHSSDFFASLADVAGFSGVTASAQLADLGLDRRGRRYVVYVDSGDVKQKASADGILWNAPTTILASRNMPGLAFQLPHGIHVFWNSTTLQSRLTGDDYQSLDAGGAGTIAADFAPQYIGFTVDRRGLGWVVGVVSAGTLQLFFTADGTNWEEVS